MLLSSDIIQNGDPLHNDQFPEMPISSVPLSDASAATNPMSNSCNTENASTQVYFRVVSLLSASSLGEDAAQLQCWPQSLFVHRILHGDAKRLGGQRVQLRDHVHHRPQEAAAPREEPRDRP